ACVCTAQRLASNRAKLSRALLDRFDLVVSVPRPRASELAAGTSEGSAAVAVRVALAREALAILPLRRTPDADALLARAVDRLPLSGRGRSRVARAARSIAALAGVDDVGPDHVRSDEHRTPTRCSRAPSTGCRCRDADGRASRAPPAASPRSPAWTTSVRIMSRRRSHTARRRSS